MSNFSKLKNMLGADDDLSQDNEQSMDDSSDDAVAQKNKQLTQDMFNSARKGLTGQDMTPGEQDQANQVKQTADNAANNVAGFAGSIGEAGNAVRPEIQELITAMKGGDTGAAQQLQNMYKATADAGATKFNPAANYGLDKVIGNGVSTEMPNASNQAYNQMTDTNFQKLKELLGNNPASSAPTAFNPPAASPLTADQISRALSRKLTGAY